MSASDERRYNLRRLDDLLESLEQLNLKEVRAVPVVLKARLVEVGVEDAESKTVPQLIEQVWLLQQPHLIDLMIDRRRRRRRQDGELQEVV